MFRRIVVSAATVAVVSAFAFVPGALGAKKHGKLLGGLDLAPYCQAHHSQVVQPNPIQGPGASRKWRFGSKPVNMTNACRWQYRRKGVVALAGNVDDAFSWQCYVASKSGTRHRTGRHRHK